MSPVLGSLVLAVGGIAGAQAAAAGERLPLNTTSPPAGPIRCAADYQPLAGLVLGWHGDSGLYGVLARVAAEVTTRGDADIWMVVEDDAAERFASEWLATAGARMERVRFLRHYLDSPWMRDYGPFFIFEGACRALVGHTYDEPRADDQRFGRFLAGVLGVQLYDIPLYHGGGNFQVSASGDAHATRRVCESNPALSEAQIRGLWQRYLNARTTFHPLTGADLTEDIDMWMQICGDRQAVVSDWPSEDGPGADAVWDAAAEMLSSRGYRVWRTPAAGAFPLCHYTYANVILANDLVLIPAYASPELQALNAEALRVWGEAMAGSAVVAIDCDPLVQQGAGLHCLALPVPRRTVGPGPAVHLQTCRGGETLRPGAQVEVRWTVDAEGEPVTAELFLSHDGGRSFHDSFARVGAGGGAFLWSVPDAPGSRTRLRVEVADANGNRGRAASQSDFVIASWSDEDGDQIDDAWERFHFGSLGFAGGHITSDGDRDGWSDLQEFRAGTDPTRAAFHPKPCRVAAYPDDGVLIEWDTQLGQRCRLETGTRLDRPGGWAAVYEVEGDGVGAMYVKSHLTGPTFFRLVTGRR